MEVTIPEDQALGKVDRGEREIHGYPVNTSSKLDDSKLDNSKLGFYMVSQPMKAELDICFIHGLMGDRLSTWTHRESQGDQVFWPQLLARAIPQARIMTYGYDANVTNLFDTTNGNGIRGYGGQFLMELTAERKSSPTRRLMFIAHSLGGLVVEEALLGSLEANQSRFKHLAASTIGVIYLGTPHRGSDLATWISVLVRLLKRWKSVNDNVVNSLRPQSEVLYIMEERFQKALHGSLKHVEICCFYEAKPWSGSTYIVEEQSATLPGYTKCSIDADHEGMAKFSGPEDPGFKKVAGELTAWIEAEEARANKEDIPATAEARRLGPGQNVGTGSTFRIHSVGDSAVFGNQSALRDINNARTQIGTRDFARDREDWNGPRRSH